MKTGSTIVLYIGLLAMQCYSQIHFESYPLVQLPGYNTDFKISRSQPWEEKLVYLCWVNHVDSSEFNIYRMVVDPNIENPELIISSSNLLSSPDVNSEGDVVWEEWIGETSIIKHYSSRGDSISSLTGEGFRSTKPNISNSLLVYIQDDTLKFLNLANQLTHNIDYGNISNPDIAPDMYTSYILVVYEKSDGDTQFIRTASKVTDEAEYYFFDYGGDNTCSNPRFGTIDWFSYQELVDSTWGISTEYSTLLRSYDMTNPSIVCTGIITAREVNDYLVLFESDSIINDREIFCTRASFDQYSYMYNISNIPGNDYNPQAFFTNLYDTVAVIWEHEVDNGRELWWAKDSLILPVSVEPGLPLLPESFLVGNAFPNPFNGNTSIKYWVETASMIDISVYDLNGRQVLETLENRTSGTYSFNWNGLNAMGGDCESGVYLVTFSDSKSIESRKVVLLK